MMFLAFLLALVLAVTATNTVTFVSQDDIDRQIIFTGNPDKEVLPALTVPGNKNVTMEFPYKWVGNWFAVSEGSPIKPGMLMEISFNSWGPLSFYDVSAIVNASDVNGVKEFFPVSGSPSTGCAHFPCGNAYYVWNDDKQSKASEETDFICTLGGGSTVARRSLDVPSKSYPREAALGKLGSWIGESQE